MPRIGAANAAQASGDSAKARRHAAKVAALTKDADTVRPEVAALRVIQAASASR